MRLKISYPLTSSSPRYPGTPAIEYQSIKSIKKGDSANTTSIIISSHSGSHIDVPKHFCQKGKSVKDIVVDFIDVIPSYCIDVDVTLGAPVRISDLEPAIHDFYDAQGIFLRTGMFRERNSSGRKYCFEHPWIHPEIPAFLKKTCPSIRVFGTDTISVSNPQHREEGRECHRRFLCGEKPILLAEDLDLSDPSLPSAPLHVQIFPWFIDDLDGVPICAFAELPDPTKNRDTRKEKSL